MIRAQPMDAVVLLGGCDKTVPAQLMGAASADLPGDPARRRADDDRAATAASGSAPAPIAAASGRNTAPASRATTRSTRSRGNLATTAGTCAVMGTASTMACIAEALGMTLPGTAAIPAVHADRLRAAEATGAAADALVELEAARPSRDHHARSRSRTRCACCSRIGGSTNAIIHLTAIAGRRGIDVPLRAPQRAQTTTPVLVDLKPTGQHYMEDFHAAGGMGAVLARVEAAPAPGLPDRDRRDPRRAPRRAAPPSVDRSVIRAARRAARSRRRPGGAVRHPRAERRDPQALGRRRRAVRARGPGGRVHVARGSGRAHRRPGPRRHARTISWCCRTPGRAAPSACRRPATCRSRRSSRRAGVKDMVRISDARMSGTAFGTIVLHVTPDAAVGRPAGAGAQRRPHPPVGQGTPHRPPGATSRAGRAARRAAAARRRVADARLRQALRARRAAGRRAAATSAFMKPSARLSGAASAFDEKQSLRIILAIPRCAAVQLYQRPMIVFRGIIGSHHGGRPGSRLPKRRAEDAIGSHSDAVTR